jgi:hypothetical protein
LAAQLTQPQSLSPVRTHYWISIGPAWRGKKANKSRAERPCGNNGLVQVAQFGNVKTPVDPDDVAGLTFRADRFFYGLYHMFRLSDPLIDFAVSQ